MQLNMLANNIVISEDEIRYAEQILFNYVSVFDNKRSKFIKNLSTIDLQAVPGSGKTTVLMAKLLILEKNLPFTDGSGILVLSHANSTINEIAGKIQVHCPKLFSYPNHVSTIQKFVDYYLAIPYYCSKYGHKPQVIDDEYYKSKCIPSSSLKNYLSYRNDKAEILYESRLLNNDEVGYIFDKRFPLKDKTKPAYKDLKQLKDNLRKWGYLCYDDAYLLAIKYIDKYPKICSYLQNRFCFIFVDEMQDMNKLQYEVLETLFGRNTIYQRIGDKNQSIYSSDKFMGDDIWQDRPDVMTINNSKRLSVSIANVVQYFGHEYHEITGVDKEDDGTQRVQIKPHLIVFNDDSIKKVVPAFANLIKKFQKNGAISPNPKYPFKVIGWRKQVKEGLCLKRYYDLFNPNITTERKTHIPNFRYRASGCYKICATLTDIIIKAFRYSDINIGSEKEIHTRGTLMSFLRDDFPDDYKELRLNMYKWCKNIYMGYNKKVASDLKNYVDILLQKFIKTTAQMAKATEYLSRLQTIAIGYNDTSECAAVENIYQCKKTGLDIEIGTVHSVKGETHTASLYLETYYQKDGKGKTAKSYESQRLLKQFRERKMEGNEGKRTKQSVKVMYVGFSRPSHLLCFAVHNNRFCPDNFPGWAIVKV